MTRRDFFKEAFAALGFSALPGGVLFAAPKGWKPEKPANLVFGVLSDTHLRTRLVGIQPGRNWSPRYFAAAIATVATFCAMAAETGNGLGQKTGEPQSGLRHLKVCRANGGGQPVVDAFPLARGSVPHPRCGQKRP